MRHLALRTLLIVATLGLCFSVGVTAFAAGPRSTGYALSGKHLPTGIERLTHFRRSTKVVRGIATFDSVPSRSQVKALRGMGLVVQPMRHVPLALVRGTVGTMVQAVTRGLSNDVYPDERLKYLDTASTDSMDVAQLRVKGLTGKGVTVAVVDSGCDASHPDLANRVVHNMVLVSPEYANARDNSSNTIVVANETGPYKNTDLGSGHGTHVAGIIAADSSTDAKGSHYGVAPDAHLICYSIGQVIFTTAVVTAYDNMLSHPNLWGIKVVNNSWGNSFRQFDPNDPVAVVTRAVAAHGVTVVFAAGNSGNAEMSLNPFSEAPWVISVAAGRLDHKLASFSSRGLQYDNSQATQIGGGGRTSWTGDRIGVYHPDVTAPGVDISSTCDTAGSVVGPCQPGQNTTASGTSMASPHVAGAAAVLLQANPKLTPNQVRQALQASATPMTNDKGKTLPFWQVGYGFVDLKKAVGLVTGSGWQSRLAGAEAAADKRVMADGFSVIGSTLWQYDAPRAAVAGSDSHTYTVDVSKNVTHLKVTLSHPS